MPTTPLLGITQVTASQNNKEVTINDAIEALENATNAKLEIDFTASNTVTLTDSQTRGAFIFEGVNATGAATLQIPTTINSNAVNRIITVRNASGHALTVQFVGAPGTTVSVPDGETRLLAAMEGTDVIVAAEPATTVTFVSLTDAPSSFSGQAGRFLTANAAENALEFADAATFPSFTSNAGRYLVVNSSEDGVEWVDLSLVTTFVGLSDTPANFTGQSGKVAAVNSGENAIEFIDLPEAEAVEFVAAQRWRINVQTPGSDPQTGFGEIQWLDRDGINLSTGGTVSASNEATGNEASAAFDDDTTAGNGWLTESTHTGAVWIEYDFGSAVSPRTVRAWPVNNLPDTAPLNFIIEYWNGAEWVDAGNRTPAPWDAVASQDFKINGQPLSSVADAPNDGTAYVRKSAAWTQPAIDDLSDVDTSTSAPTDGQALIWDNANSVWVPGNVATSSGGVFKVRAASTANVTLATDVENGDTLDGVTLATGDRILLKDQTASEENGVYVVAASGAPTRAEDADESDELVNYACFVAEGTANADKFFQCTTNAPITVDTTALTWAEVTGGGGGDVAVEDDGTEIVAAASRLNYTGAGVTVTDSGSGEVEINIPGGGGGGSIYNELTLTNPSFDVDMSGWTVESGTWTAETSQSSTNPRSGARAAFPNTGDGVIYQDVTLSSDAEIFVFGCYIAGTGSAERAALRVQFFDSSDNQIGEDHNSIYADTRDNVYERRTITLPVPDNTSYARCALVAVKLEGSANNILFDDCFAYYQSSGGDSAAETITETGTSANLLNANRGKYQRWTATGAKTLTVQPDATEAITQDAEFTVANRAASDNLTISAGSGVTINAPSGGGLVLEPGMVATLKRVATDEFDLIGQTAT